MVLVMLRRPEVDTAFAKAAALLDNNQAWDNALSVHAQLPGIRAFPFWNKADFPWLLKLEERYEDIKAELMQIWNVAGFRAEFVSKELPEKVDDWQEMTLLTTTTKDGKSKQIWNTMTCEKLAPITCSLLQSRPELDPNNLRLPKPINDAVKSLNKSRQDVTRFKGTMGFELRWPTLMVKFYMLRPGAVLRPHFGSHGRLAAHLGIVVPQDCCSLRVGSETREWKEGEVMVFDDSYVHEAKHVGSEPRVVLGIFFLHPDLQRPSPR